jgi:hypothetical protein
MPPPDLDLPPRPVPRAPLTDVVPRRTLVIIAVVVALAVLGTVLAVALSGGDTSDNGSGAKAGASASASTKEDRGAGRGARAEGSNPSSAGGTPSGNRTDGGASASADSSGPSAAKGGGSAPAVSTRKGGQGYSIGLPKGWSYGSSDSAGDRYTGPDGQKLLVAWTTTPKDDPVADWKDQERYMVRSQYHKVGIEKVDYRGWNTADWEFTYVDGAKYHTVDRGFVVNGSLGYGLMYTAKDADWDSALRKDTWKTLTTSFTPKS